MLFRFGHRHLDLSTPHVMGILNVTPDSFYDGGRYHDHSHALRQAEAMVDAGASFVDIGGESTRPGAKPVNPQQELDRVLPLVEAVVERLDVVVSVDTSTPEIMQASAAAGAGFINDVRALQRPLALTAAAHTGLPVCLMHMPGEPQRMQDLAHYDDVVAEVSDFLLQRVSACHANNIADKRIVLDPGFGFGKTDEHNIALLQNLDRLSALGYPLLVGLSRKSTLGRLLGREVDQRLAGSLAFALYALQKGARILRVHDVAETMDVVTIYKTLEKK